MEPENIQIEWTQEIPGDQWSVYQDVITRARAQGIPFALGGAFAVATYTGRWRNTKDLDLYIQPEDREAMIQILADAGLQDYYDRLPYVREWIYRSYREQQGNEIIVDIIWAMANDRTQVDEPWLSRGPLVEVRGESLQIAAPEEMIWGKLYVLQKDRCDWPDILNIVYAVGPGMDWEHLISRLGADAPLLAGVLSVFRWLSPARARELPVWLWERIHLPWPETISRPRRTMRERVHLLDTRPWFIPVIPEDEDPF